MCLASGSEFWEPGFQASREETMRTQLGELLRNTRLNQRLTPQDVARRLGYRNLNKGARRVERLERTGNEAHSFIETLAAVLACDQAHVADLKVRDDVARRSAFEACLNVPQPMQLYRKAAGLAIGAQIPDGLTEEEAVAYAIKLQRTEGLPMCLVLDRRRSLWIDKDGALRLTQAQMGHSNSPYNTLG